MLISIYLIPIILYHDDKIYNTDDAFYLIGGTLFLSMAFGILYYIRESGLATIIYLVTITIASDTFAYFTGMLIGKHKRKAADRRLCDGKNDQRRKHTGVQGQAYTGREKRINRKKVYPGRGGILQVCRR